jgi:two-component system phosphate regulon sensor histidine kinase PhoR
MYGHDVGSIPESSPVKKVSNDYFVVDVNDQVNPEVLEFYLKNEFRKVGINTDFEYGIYDCETDQMIYGNYVRFSDNSEPVISDTHLPKYPELVYYFGIRFPKQANYVLGNQKIWIVLTSVSLIILLFFTGIIFIVFRQKRLSELQRDFVNNMTHEFKTPITASKIALEYIKNHEAIRSDERLEKYCNLILSQTDHLNSQIERILQISFSEKRSFSIHKEMIDLSRLIEKITASFINSERDIKYTRPRKSLFIMADEVHTTSVLYGLIDNAIKYSRSNTIVNISLKSDRNKIFLTVSDKGIGIDKKDLKRIFDKFYRVSSGDVHNVKGFGLGLYYVKRVCLRHGWKIKVRSTPGVGSEFLITMKKLSNERS